MVLAGLAALLILAGRGWVQDLFTVFTMLALAQYWNLLAGFAGLVLGRPAGLGSGSAPISCSASPPRRASDPVLAILLAGVGAVVVAVPTAFVVFRLRSAYFAIGTPVVAEVFRLVLAQVKSLGGGTGIRCRGGDQRQRPGAPHGRALGLRTAAARDVASYWLALALAAGTIAFVYAVLRSRRGLALAAIRDSETAALSVGSTPSA